MGVTAAIAAVVGTGYSIYSGEQNRAAQKDAAAKAEANAKKTQEQAEEQTNAANKKSADSASALSSAQQNAKGGASGTMLTGASGVDSSQLTLGKSTLLGQ